MYYFAIKNQEERYFSINVFLVEPHECFHPYIPMLQVNSAFDSSEVAPVYIGAETLNIVSPEVFGGQPQDGVVFRVLLGVDKDYKGIIKKTLQKNINYVC